jgi:hypothetical protein
MTKPPTTAFQSAKFVKIPANDRSFPEECLSIAHIACFPIEKRPMSQSLDQIAPGLGGMVRFKESCKMILASKISGTTIGALL